MDTLAATAPLRPPPWVEPPELTPLQRHRLNFFHAERFGQSEVVEVVDVEHIVRGLPA